MSLHTELAERLWNAQITGTPCSPLTDDYPELTVEDAYEIQGINLERRMNEEGLFGAKARMVGRKIGITSLPIQEWLGVTEPDFGGLLDDMDVPNGGKADMSKLVQPRVEGEIAFVLKKCLLGPGISAAQVIAATDFILPSIEIIGSRLKDWKFKIQDTVADNAAASMFVLGSQPARLEDYDLRTIGMTLRYNGSVVSTGAGAACLGNPVNAVTWLVNKLGEFGTTLNTGDVILSGALGPVQAVKEGDHVSVQIGMMGEVSVSF